MMVARSLGSIAADALTVPERVLLFCVGSGTDWQTAGITGATVTMLAVRGTSRPAPAPLDRIPWCTPRLPVRRSGSASWISDRIRAVGR
jgi:hypothetical protein